MGRKRDAFRGVRHRAVEIGLPRVLEHARRGLHLLSSSTYSALQGLIKSSFVFLIFLLRDATLLALDFQLEEFFLQGLQQHS